MDYDRFFADSVDALRAEGRYRVFADLERVAGQFPRARRHVNGQVQTVDVWCSNDYLGMGQHPAVTGAMTEAIAAHGAGAGGTRNISGTAHVHVQLEAELAALHSREAALIFTSGYIANVTTLGTLAARLPAAIVYSDGYNHNSLIEGMRWSRVEKRIFRHNDAAHLDALMAADDPARPKIVVFESVYSMDGDIAPIADLCDVADRHGALTYLDEVHAVGMYGPGGAGVAARDGVGHRPAVIQGTLGKAFGVVGGYIAGSASLIDFVRSFGNAFIFTTALPPAIAAGALAAVRHLRNSDVERERHQERATTVKQRLAAAGLPVMNSASHIVPVMVGDARLCKLASDRLLDHFGIYVQPINYPTVARGTERLRITPTPLHDDAAVDRLIAALGSVWEDLKLGRSQAA
ncbi:MAG: 5-aminolevulinate synthase [Alphaproteobacteria bacterium]